MWPYTILFIFCVFMLIINNIITKKIDKRIVEIITLCVLCLMSGTRYYLGGTDYLVYLSVYTSIPKLKDFFINFNLLDQLYTTYGFERGYLFLNSLVKTLGFNFFGFTLIHSVIFYTFLYKGLKRYTYNFNLLIMVFLYKMFFYNTFISMRQSIAIVIFFYAIRYIEMKKPIKYFMLCLIALFFHNTAIILFPIYFINSIKLTKKIVIYLNLIFIPTIIISLLNIPIMKLFDFIVNIFSNPVSINKSKQLFLGNPSAPLGLFHTLEYLLLMFFVLFYFNKIINTSKDSELILKLFVILLPIFTLLRGYGILTRIKDYFTFTYGIILGYLCLMDNKKYEFIVQICTIIICAYGFFRFIFLFDGGAMIPYDTYILKNISIFSY